MTRAEQAAVRFQRQVEQFTGPRLIRIMNEAVRALRDVIKSRYMGASRTMAKRLARNTGKMEQRTVARRAAKDANGNISATIAINVPYASVHFGEGTKTETIIKPKYKQALTIPLPAAQGPDKRAKFAANSKQITHKYVREGILYGRMPGRFSAPLYLLRNSVTVPVRVSVERDIQPEGQRILQAIIEREVKKIFGEA